MIHKTLCTRYSNRQKLKFFKPVIHENWFGWRSTKWVARPLPLTDEQLNRLLK